MARSKEFQELVHRYSQGNNDSVIPVILFEKLSFCIRTAPRGQQIIPKISGAPSTGFNVEYTPLEAGRLHTTFPMYFYRLRSETTFYFCVLFLSLLLKPRISNFTLRM